MRLPSSPVNVLKEGHLLRWFFLFLLINVALDIPNATNAFSRYATMVSIAERHTVRIDSYEGLTIDWAQTPDGHFYSNKAPGPALAGAPVFFLIDKWVTRGLPNQSARDLVRERYRGMILNLLSFLFQILPYSVLSAFAIVWLKQRGATPIGQHLAAVGLLFGNTAALFMNTFFGHGMAACFLLALLIALCYRRFFWVGLTFGCALLCDYGAASLIPALIIVIIGISPGLIPLLHAVQRVFWGGWIPAIVWGVYHRFCFGSALTLPGKFQNPQFVEQNKKLIWGIIGLFPDSTALFRLVFGPSRGILWTQPWLLLTLALLPSLWKKLSSADPKTFDAIRPLVLFLVPGLACLLWMNAAFGAWHAGHTPGPRYLSIIFPGFALLLGLLEAHFSPSVRRLAVGLMVFSVCFYILVFASRVWCPDGQNLWPYYVHRAFEHPPWTGVFRVALQTIAFGYAILSLAVALQKESGARAPV